MMVTFAAGLIALLLNPEARAREHPRKRQIISDEELKAIT